MRRRWNARESARTSTDSNHRMHGGCTSPAVPAASNRLTCSRIGGCPSGWLLSELGVGPGRKTKRKHDRAATWRNHRRVCDRAANRGRGSGVVYAARHPRLPRLTALKILKRDDVAEDDEVWRRFEREADIAAHFDHPNIVQVYDRGVAENQFWISMQYIDGVDAAELHRVSPDRGLRIGTEIAAALDYAHGKGVLHRDVKPSNILIADPDSGRPERGESRAAGGPGRGLRPGPGQGSGGPLRQLCGLRLCRHRGVLLRS
ncbi:serine/threonine-protein kinase, partial [Streptomyces sp. NPDC059083]|uniref:serine/threonine-protein kinase n=1 Tax=Streptomyces sp. NPDC059083 TaxID=3346721 RepID=UPI0036A58591